MIRVEHLVKSFGDLKAVDDISFEIAAGEIFAFLGPNGAGKTTTIQMLTTLLRPTSGSMMLDGLDPASRPHDVRRRFGIVFQDPSLDSELTAYENMELHGVLYHVPRRTRAERIQQLLTLFELWDRRQTVVKQFSGGMKRRLEIARGLLHTPKILFLDEPTLGLDPQSRNQLWTHVKHLNATEQVTVFLTTHYMGGRSAARRRRLCRALVLIVCLIAGFRPAHLSTLPLVALFMVLISIVFAALGTAIGSQLQNMQGFQLIMNFLVMPIFFLSGALFPLTGLPDALALATRIDPLTYGIDGLRGAFIEAAHFSMATDVAVLAVTACVFLVLGARAFAKIQI